MTGSSQPLVITDFLYRARDMFGDKQIIDHVDGVETMRYDYRTYADRVLRLAAALVARGVRPGDRVGTLAWNHHRHLELYLAIPLAGAVLHTINIRLEADEIAYIVDHADNVLVFADPSLEHLLSTARQRRPDMAVVLLDDGEFEEIIAGAAPLDAPIRRDEDDLAALCYTSGTTGAPKGVGYRHKSLYLHTFAAYLADGHAISERDRVLLVVPMFHANAWGVPFAAMMSGADQVLPGPHPSAPEIATIIATQRITYTGMVPTVAVDLVAHATRENIDLRSLRALVLGGSTPSTGLIRDIEERLGVPAYQGWGMTEISPMATFSRPPAGVADDDTATRAAYIRKQGRLLPGLQWRLIADDGSDAPHDGHSRGEVVIRGPWVATEYFRDPHPDRFLDGWLRTGDIGTIDSQGFLEIVDRAKDLIKSGGEWISSLALEEQLLAHPGVAEAAVVAVAHPRWQERPVAYWPRTTRWSTSSPVDASISGWAAGTSRMSSGRWAPRISRGSAGRSSTRPCRSSAGCGPSRWASHTPLWATTFR